MLASALAMEGHAEALLRRASGRDPAPEGVLKLVVEDGSLFDPMPLLRRFREAEPLIELALEDTEGSAEARISRLHADVAILVTNSPPEDLVGRQLTRVQLAWLASAQYVETVAGVDSHPERCQWITWNLASSSEIDDAWHRAALRRLTPRPLVVMQTDRHAQALAAVRAGVGVSLLNAAHEGGLVRLRFPELREAFGVWLLTHPDLRRSGRVRALFEFVADATLGAAGIS